MMALALVEHEGMANAVGVTLDAVTFATTVFAAWLARFVRLMRLENVYDPAPERDIKPVELKPVMLSSAVPDALDAPVPPSVTGIGSTNEYAPAPVRFT